MRWFSSKGEYAFLSIGGTAKGVIAIGGTAVGVVAIGGIISIGAISIGMNSVGTVAAIGMNTAAPISISLINGVGVLSLAGVNGWGAWTRAGVNATSMAGGGGINTAYSIIPALLIIVALLIGSSVIPGRWEPRDSIRRGSVKLRSFLRSKDLGEQRVRGSLRRANDGGIELFDGDETLSILDVERSALESARHIARGKKDPSPVIALLSRSEEDTVAADEEGDYRARPRMNKRSVVRCLEIVADEPESLLPKDTGELTWVLAWSARIATVSSIAMLAWLMTSG